MGFTVTFSADSWLLSWKSQTCILVPADDELAPPRRWKSLPFSLLSVFGRLFLPHCYPSSLFWFIAKPKNLEKAEEYIYLIDWIAGACAYVCPSEIPLVIIIRQENLIFAIKRREESLIRRRYALKAQKARLHKEKEEREEKHRLALEHASFPEQRWCCAAKDKNLPAALARAKAKKERSQSKQWCGIEVSTTRYASSTVENDSFLKNWRESGMPQPRRKKRVLAQLLREQKRKKQQLSKEKKRE